MKQTTHNRSLDSVHKQRDAKEWAESYDTSTGVAFWQEMDGWLFSDWKARIAPGSLIIDLGCGTGRSSLPFLGINRVVSLDISPWMLKLCKGKLENQAHVILGGIENLPFKDESFDVAISYGAFHHLPNPFQGLDEALRVLKRRGRLFCLEYNKTRIKGSDDILGLIRGVLNKALRVYVFQFRRHDDTRVETHPGHPGKRYSWEYERHLNRRDVKFELSSVGFSIVPQPIYWNNHFLSKISIKLDLIIDKLPLLRGKGRAMILRITKTD